MMMCVRCMRSGSTRLVRYHGKQKFWELQYCTVVAESMQEATWPEICFVDKTEIGVVETSQVIKLLI
jgi:hypothetical protein